VVPMLAHRGREMWEFTCGNHHIDMRVVSRDTAGWLLHHIRCDDDQDDAGEAQHRGDHGEAYAAFAVFHRGGADEYPDADNQQDDCDTHDDVFHRWPFRDDPADLRCPRPPP
jgi:hypothetical protein